jgi:riboflavin synthase
VFTGIVTALGRIEEVRALGGGRDMRIRIATPPGWLEGVALGASICCSGCCLTAVEFTPEASRSTPPPRRCRRPRSAAGGRGGG